MSCTLQHHSETHLDESFEQLLTYSICFSLAVLSWDTFLFRCQKLYCSFFKIYTIIKNTWKYTQPSDINACAQHTDLTILTFCHNCSRSFFLQKLTITNGKKAPFAALSFHCLSLSSRLVLKCHYKSDGFMCYIPQGFPNWEALWFRPIYISTITKPIFEMSIQVHILCFVEWQLHLCFVECLTHCDVAKNLGFLCPPKANKKYRDTVWRK